MHLFLELEAEDLLAVAVQDKILAVVPSEEDATSPSDSRFKLEELGQSSIGKKCCRLHQAFIGLVDELVANLQVGLGPHSLLHSGTVSHQNILNQARFFRLVELKDQHSKGQTSLGKTTTLFGTESQKHKFDRFAEKAKNPEDIRLQ